MSGEAGVPCGREEVGEQGIVGEVEIRRGGAGEQVRLLMRCWESRDEAAPLSAAGKTASSVFSHLAADDGADAPACRNITRNVRAALTASIFFST